MAEAVQPVLILGVGQYAADVADMMADIPGIELAGYIEDRRRELASTKVGSRPVHWIEEIEGFGNDHLVVPAIAHSAREVNIQRLRDIGFGFVTACHSSAHVAASAGIGLGARRLARF